MARQRRAALLLLGAVGWCAVAGNSGGVMLVAAGTAAAAVFRSTGAPDQDALGTGGAALAAAAAVSSDASVYVESGRLSEGAVEISRGRSLLHGCHSKRKASRQTNNQSRIFLKCVAMMPKCPRCRFPRGRTKGHCKQPALKRLYNCNRSKEGVGSNGKLGSKGSGSDEGSESDSESDSDSEGDERNEGKLGDEYDDADSDADEEIVPTASIYESGYEY